MLSEIEKYYPFENGKITKYDEPFVGGAVLFDILSKYALEAVYISDINAEFINTYCIVRDDIDKLIDMLATMQNEFGPMNTDDRKVYYLGKRERFNDLKVNGNENINIEKAALLLISIRHIGPLLTQRVLPHTRKSSLTMKNRLSLQSLLMICIGKEQRSLPKGYPRKYMMDLKFDDSIANDYHSATQIARVLTEAWVGKNMFCPRCGNPYIEHFENNRPVADFFCPRCKNEYELKSKNGQLGTTINDGAYETMILRITGNQNPDFFFMSYSRQQLRVHDFMFVPKHFFVPDIIEKRKPLSPGAHRAGWVGCNIRLSEIPEQGKIAIVKNGIVEDVQNVVCKVAASCRLEIKDMNSRGWIFDILNCINRLPYVVFTLNDVYMFEPELTRKHPQNNNIKAKIRQQLQVLRDKDVIEFLGNGRYKKII